MTRKRNIEKLSCLRGPILAVGPGGLAICMCCGATVPLKKDELCTHVKCPKCNTRMVRC
ncbi:MAG: hypothetical protein QXO71_05680 [Candidatus Jordarchaeaceae archaeon]